MMKTKLMSMAALALLVAFNANAQIEKGTWLLGGNASYNKNKSDVPLQPNQLRNSLESGALTTLMAGIAFRQNQVAGLMVSYAPVKVIEEILAANGSISKNERRGHQKSIGVFHRVYKPLGNNFYFLAQTSANYLNGKTGITKTNGFDLSLSPGIAYQILKNVHLEVSIPNILGVYHYKSTSADIMSIESTSVGFNLNARPIENLGIGFKVLIP
jgi:hypothetical protein